MTKSPKRRVPMVFRFAAVLLLAAAIVGLAVPQQPAGSATRLVLSAAAHFCPSAVRGGASPSIADGAHAIDRWGFRVIADAVDPQPKSRCARPVQGK